jgi:hypothetical protein
MGHINAHRVTIALENIVQTNGCMPTRGYTTVIGGWSEGPCARKVYVKSEGRRLEKATFQERR